MAKAGSFIDKIILYKSKTGQEAYAFVTAESDTALSCTELINPRTNRDIDVKLQRNEFTGDRELYKTYALVQVPKLKVTRLFPVATLGSYQETEGILLRRTLSTDGSSFMSSLDSVCLCNQPLNPDIPYCICSLCKKLYHESCLTDTYTCPDCDQPFKRPRLERGIPSPSKQVRTESSSSRSGAGSMPIDVEKYKTLPEVSKQKLYTEALKLQNEMGGLEDSYTSEDKVRQQIIIKMMCGLLLAKEENSADLHVGLQEIKVLAMEIETAVFICTGSRASKPDYKKKVRSVVFNLLDEKNPDFRSDILNSLIRPRDIVQMESRDMASGAVKNFRSERQKVYAQEQLVLPQTSEKVLIKTHKGDVILDVHEGLEHEEDAQSNGEDDPFNPASYEDEADPLYEQVKSWSRDSIRAKLSRRMQQYFPQDADRLISQINMLNPK